MRYVKGMIAASLAIVSITSAQAGVYGSVGLSNLTSTAEYNETLVAFDGYADRPVAATLSLGYQMDISDRYFAGLEVGYRLATEKKNVADISFDDLTFTSKDKGSTQVRGILGYNLSSSFHPYVTVGYALTRFDDITTRTYDDGGTPATATNNNKADYTGVSFGTGGDVEINDRFTLSPSYVVTHYQSKSFTDSEDSARTLKTTPMDREFRLALKMKLG